MLAPRIAAHEPERGRAISVHPGRVCSIAPLGTQRMLPDNLPMKTVAIVNNKGGVGRTTTAVHVAHRAAELGIRTTAVSLCRQGDLSRWLAPGRAPAATGDLVRVSEFLDVVHSPDKVPLVEASSLVVYDCPPGFEWPAGAQAPDLWLVPTAATRVELEGLVGMLPQLAAAGSPIWCVLNAQRIDPVKALQGLREVASKVPNVRVSEHVIPECPSIIEAEHMQLPVWEVPNRARSTGGLALIGLCDEVFAYFGLAATH